MKKAFTLAEVLITLTIIGIVAAVTIPALMVDVNQKAFDNQRKALHARLANALSSLDKLNGYGVYVETPKSGGRVEIKDTATETFIVDGLSKVYKIRQVCKMDKMTKCGLSETFLNAEGDSVDIPLNLFALFGSNNVSIDADAPSAMQTAYQNLNSEISARAIETVNGESIAVYYNPGCIAKNRLSATNFYMVNRASMCVNFIYDLNGLKAPNQMGKDMGFMTAFYRIDPVVAAPVVDERWATGQTSNSYNAADVCENLGEEYRLPTTEELISIAANSIGSANLTFPIMNVSYWTSDVTVPGEGASGRAARVYMSNTRSDAYSTVRTDNFNIVCVKR